MLVELAKTIIPDGRFRDWLKAKRSSFVCRSRLNSNDDVEIMNSIGYVNMYFPKLGDVEMRFLKDDLFAYYFVPVDLPGYFSDKLPASDVYVDCGSFPGDYAIAIARQNVSAKIIALEPDVFNREYLRRTLFLNSVEDRVNICPKALSFGNGKSYIVHNKCGSFLQADIPEGVEFSEVKTIALDDLLDEHFESGARIHVKMDIEGAELDSLKGMRRSLEKGVTFSIASYHNVDGTQTHHALKEFFDKNNYISFTQSPRHLTTIAFPRND